MTMKLGIADGTITKPTADDAKFTGVVGDDGKYTATITGLETGAEVAAGTYQAFFFDDTTKEVLGDYTKLGAFTYEGGSTPTKVTTSSSPDGENVTADPNATK
ncbi:hypothetical protein [Lactiplantibacillus daowaiensis]|uniref:Uncharacterized protein n=1 Tax=Lactiplantibacillus daowaiensis TaxID=2559918 RepID=A0ABW1RXU0_9LACO|nr:hypothetical protein [Lactiplantibacillus daowaiensis]